MSESYVRPDVRQFLDYYNKLPGPRAHQVGPKWARAMMLASRHVADAEVGELAVIRNLACPGPAGEIRLRLYDSREQREAGPLLIFFHGGGFVFGDLDTHEPFCAEVARRSICRCSRSTIGSRPSTPSRPAPRIASRRRAGRRRARLAQPAGDRPRHRRRQRRRQFRDRRRPRAPGRAGRRTGHRAMADLPRGGPTKGYPSYRDFGEGYFLSRDGLAWFDDCYRPDKADWRCSPLLRSQAGMPPTLVQTASLDPIRDQGRAYAAACAEAGVPVVFREAKGNIHGYINLRGRFRRRPRTSGRR